MARILAVEDEADLRELLQEELEAEGHEVVTAYNGAAALRSLQSFIPDIVISDVSMPELDGFGFLEQFRALYPALADTPFLFLTALKSRQDEIRARDFGVDDYLTKPVDFDMLHSILATRLRQVARMNRRKEQQMVKLYKALSPQPGEAPADLTLDNASLNLREELELPPSDIASAAPAEIDTEHPDVLHTNRKEKRVFGGLFRFPNLQRTAQEVPEGGPGLRQQVMRRAKEILTGLVCDKDVVATVNSDCLAVCYRDGDEHAAKRRTDAVGQNLQQAVLEEQSELWKSEVGLDDETIEKALVVSESLFQIAIAPQDYSPQEFAEAIHDAIDQTRSNPRAPNLLLESIRRDQGRLMPQRMIARNGDSLPIRFFAYDDQTKRKLCASYAFFGKSSREKASYLVDVLTLDLMENAVRELESADIAVIDVHYLTLASKIYSQAYVRKFLQFARHPHYSFMLNVRSVPHKLTTAAFEDLVRPLGNHVTRRSIQIEPGKIGAIARNKLSVSCVVCSYPGLSASPDAAASLGALKSAMNRSGTLLVLRGLSGEGDIEAVKGFGFDGYAIDCGAELDGRAT